MNYKLLINRRSLIITINLICFLFSACNQDLDKINTLSEFKNFKFFSEKEKINWENIDSKIDKKKKLEIYKKIKPLVFPGCKECYEYITNSDLYKSTHLIDINSDGKLDVIYEGPSGAEGDKVQIFLYEKDKFTNVFEGYQNLQSLNIENGKLKSFILLNFGCCADYNESQVQYFVNNKFEIKPLFERTKVSYIHPPKSIFKSPIKFKVINDKYTLRSSPLVDDTATYIWDKVTEGNWVERFPKGSTGYAWAEKKDKTGRIWWFVEMEPLKSQKGSSHGDEFIPTRHLGWMSSRFLKKLEK